MTVNAYGADDGELARDLAENAIRRTLYRYCRGIDRRGFELVRACYHSDALDDHGTTLAVSMASWITPRAPCVVSSERCIFWQTS